MMVPKCDRCQAIDVQVVQVLGRDLCGRCRDAFDAWVNAGHLRATNGITMAAIQHAVCDYFGVTAADLMSARRHRAVSFPRMVAMYLCRNRAGASFPEIGRAFGKDHTTVMAAVRKVRTLVEAADARAIAAMTAIYARIECG
jgi:chromosomal replication initiation ATPase DnaA